MPNPKLDAEGFPIPASANGPKLDAEGFPLPGSVSVAKAATPPPVQEPRNFPEATPDFEAYRQSQKAIPLEGETEFAPIMPGQSSPSVAPSLPKASELLTKIKAIPGKVKAFALEKEAEHQAAVKAQRQRLGTVGQILYPETLVEAGKAVAGKVQKLWEGLRPNDAKRNAQWAESDMRDLLKEVGDKAPTPEQYQRFKDRAAYAKEMWGLAETERGKRKEVVQGFAKRMDDMTLPGTPGAKLLGGLAPLAVQAAVAPESIPIEMAANAVAEGQLRNPTYEQTLGQQAKEAIAGYGTGRFMMSGMPGVPVSRALQNLGMNPVAANLTGMVPTSVTNVLGGHQVQRYLTTPHGDTPEAPTFTDFLHDYATQLGLGARHLNQRLAQPAGAPLPLEPAAPVQVAQRLQEAPQAPGAVNPTPTETAPFPGPSVVQGPAAAPGVQPGNLQTIFPGVPPVAGPADLSPGTSFGWKGRYGSEPQAAQPPSETGVNIVDSTSYRGQRQGPLLGPNDQHLVARDASGKDIGRLWVTQTPTGFEVRKVETDPGARNKGVATQLYLEARSKFGPYEGSTDTTPDGKALLAKLQKNHPDIFTPDQPVQRPQPSPSEGLPDAYGLAPVQVETRAPAPKATLSEHEAEMAMTKQQRQGDRVTLVNGPVRETADIAPEHHAEADRVIEARNIVTVAERRALEAERKILEIEIENRERKAKGQEPKAVPEALAKQAKSRLSEDDPLRQLAASEPEHPDAQRALQIAQEQQQALAAEYASSVPEGEGDITHASRVALKETPDEPSLGARVKEFFGGARTTPAQAGIPGTGKRPKQKNEYSKSRLYETVESPMGPVVVYKGEPGDMAYEIVGRSGKIQESDITGRRESTKDEITHATSQVEVEIPGEVDPETGEAGPSRTVIEIDPDVAINFSRNAVAAAVKARESARDAIRGRKVLDDLKANPKLYQEGEAKPGSEWRDVSELPITNQAKMRLAPGGKKAAVRSDAAQTLIEYFGQATAKEASFLTGLNAAARRWTERGLLTNVFAHFPNQFAHGLGALSGEGMTPQQATNALAHAYRQGQNPNSEYINRAKAAGVKQMSEGRVFGENDNLSAHEAATQQLEAALGHAPGSLGKAEGSSIKRAFKALNQKTVWQVDDAIRNTLFYQKIASGMTPEQAAKYANENYVGYHTDTNLFELSPSASPRRGDQVVKKGLNEIYRNLVTGKGETGKGFAGAGASLARTLVSPLFHTFRTNSATLLAHELKGAATGLPQGDLKGLGKLANVAAVGTAVGGAVGQTLSDAFLSEDEKKQGKEYQMRMGGPFHWYDTVEKALEGRATPMQTAAAIATPNPLFKHVIGKGIFGVDVQSGRRAPAASLAELGDTLLSSVLPTGDIGRNALQGQGSGKDMAASFLMGKNAPNPAFQMMMAHPDKLAAGTPDYEANKANFRLISQLRELEPGSKEFSDTIQQAVKDQLLTKRQIENAAKRSGQTELEHARALAKISTPEWAANAADWYAEKSPEIARVLYAEAQKKLGAESKKFTGQRNLKLLGQIQRIENKKLLLR